MDIIQHPTLLGCGNTKQDRYISVSVSMILDTSPHLPTKEIKIIQSIVGALLYYTRAVDPSMYPALNEASLTQANPTQRTLQQSTQLLDFVSTHPNATI